MATEFLELMEDAGNFIRSQEAARGIPDLDLKLAHIIEKFNRAKRLPSHSRNFVLTEVATTSDFPLLFGNILERVLVAKYTEAPADVFNYIGRGTQKDFRSKEYLDLHGGEGVLPEVLQRGEYKGVELGEGKATSVIKKYGRVYPYSWETLINDNLGALQIVDRFNRAARHTENYRTTQLIADPTEPAVALFGDTVAHPLETGTTVDNLNTLALTVDNLATVLTAMRSQVDFNNNPIIFSQFHLVVPPQGEIKAYEVVQSGIQLAAAGTSDPITTIIRGTVNPLNRLNITVHVNPYLPIINTTNGNASWYVFSDPSADGPAAVMNFLVGNETPAVHIKAPDKMLAGGGLASPQEGDFATDTIRVRVRHMLGGVVLDPRRCYVSTGGF